MAKVAVIGSGVAGLTAAYLLQRRYEVLLFEADGRLGGHAHTHELATRDGGVANVDTGFIVHNERTYPNLVRLFRELNVSTMDSEMSMSVRCDGCGLEYAGAKKLKGLFPTRKNLVNPRYLRMLAEVTRFYRHAQQTRATEDTLGEFLVSGRYSRYFVDHFIKPVVSAVWSCGAELTTDYPARYLFEFLANHGMLSIGGTPQWKTVVGGSRTYVERAVKNLTAVHVSTPIRRITRKEHSVELRDDADQVHTVDKVVIATHPDQALQLLQDPTPRETNTLKAFRYERNETWLHTDTRVLPSTKNAWASWNLLKQNCADTGPVRVSYHMNRLMRLVEPVDYVVTLNAADIPNPLATMVYEHPIYTRESVAAQANLPKLNTGTTAYAGAYHGWGFHEDGCASGVRAAKHFGVDW